MTGSLPQGRESLFWLNIKAIPSASKQMNSLQIAVKTRIKLIYRPETLRASTPEEQANKLTWRRAGNTLQVNNPTPYVINFNEITLGNKKLDGCHVRDAFRHSPFSVTERNQWQYADV